MGCLPMNIVTVEKSILFAKNEQIMETNYINFSLDSKNSFAFKINFSQPL